MRLDGIKKGVFFPCCPGTCHFVSDVCCFILGYFLPSALFSFSSAGFREYVTLGMTFYLICNLSSVDHRPLVSEDCGTLLEHLFAR